MTIIGTFPTTIANGQVEDATIVMSLFSWIQAQTNGNACPATVGTLMLKGDGVGGTTGAAAGTDYVSPTALSAPTGSSLVGFQLSATGAAAQTLFTKASQIVSVTDFYANGVSGALVVGDGVTDCYGGIQAALNALRPGQRLYFPTSAAYYKYGTTLIVSAVDITFESESKNSGMKFTGTGPAILVQNSFFSMRNILLMGTGGAYGSGASGTHGVQVQGASNIGNFLFKNTTIQNFGSDGINMAGGVYTIDVDGCTIQGNGGNGIASTISGSDQNGNALNINACGIYGNAGDGIKWKASALNITGANVFEVNKGYGVRLTWGGVASSPLPSGFSIKGNYFENNLLGQIGLEGNGGVYVNGGEIESNYMLMSNAAGGTGSATGPMGVAITATAFINAANSGYYGVRNVRIGKNTYSTTGTSLAYTHIDGGVVAGVGAFDPSVIIEQSVADDTRYVNLGDAQFQKILKTVAISGKIHSMGLAWSTPDKSDNVYVNGAVVGYFELPFKGGDGLWSIAMTTQQASAQSYTVTLAIETADATAVTGYSGIGISQTFTNATGGTVLNTLSLGSILYRYAANYKARLKVTITMGAAATTMYLWDPLVTIV